MPKDNFIYICNAVADAATHGYVRLGSGDCKMTEL